MRHPEHEKSWVNLKTTFIDAHQEVRDTDAAVDEINFHSVNAIVSQIIDQLRSEIPTENDRIMHLSNQSSISLAPIHVNQPVVTHVNPPVILTEITNATQQTDPSMTNIMIMMMANMEAIRLRIEGNETHHAIYERGRGCGCGRGRGRGRGKLGRGHGGRTTCQHHTTGKYCHMHSNCAHASSKYETPAEYHKYNATFINMINGNANNCS